MSDPDVVVARCRWSDGRLGNSLAFMNRMAPAGLATCLVLLGTACTDGKPRDAALAAAQRACDRYASADLWTAQQVDTNGTYEGTVVMTVRGAEGVVESIGRDVAVARRDARFKRLGEATDTLARLLHGDRTEVQAAEEGMDAACRPLARR